MSNRKYLPPWLQLTPRWVIVCIAVCYALPLHILCGIRDGLSDAASEIRQAIHIDDE